MSRKRTRIFGRSALLSLGFLAGASLWGLQPPPLELLSERGKAHSLSSGLQHVYRIDLKAGDLLDVVVEQRGLDVSLVLTDPAGQPLLTVDSPTDKKETEPLLWVADKPGTYRMTVIISKSSDPGADYQIQLAERRRATPVDRKRALALRSYYRAKDLKRHQAKPADVIAGLVDATRSLDAYGPLYPRAYSWSDLGKAYFDQNDWPKAAGAYRKAAPLFHRLRNKEREAQTLGELAQCELRTLEIDGARRHFEEALGLAGAADDKIAQAKFLYNLGMFYAERADAWNATRYATKSLMAWRGLGDADGQAQSLMVFGVLYSRMGLTEKAVQNYDAALRLHVELKTRAYLLSQMGHALVYGGRPDRAFQYYRQAFEINQRTPDPDNVASTLVGLGLAYVYSNQPREAVDPYRRALRAYSNKKDPRGEATTLMNLGWVLGRLGRYDESRDSFAQALRIIRQLKNSRLEAAVLLGSAWVERRQGHLEEAQRQAEQAKNLVETVRSGTAETDVQVAFFSSIQDVYDLLIGILMDRYKLENSPALLAEAMEISESARARNLLDNLGVSRRSEPADGIAAHVLTAREIQQRLLDPDTVLLEYFLGKLQSYLWLVTREDVQRFELPGQSAIEGLAQETYELLSERRPVAGHAAIQKAWELSRLLLGPVGDRLGTKRLLIVCSGALQSIPFGALPDPAAPRSRTDPHQPWPEPLLLRHEVLQEPSASVLAGIRRGRARRPRAARLVAALGDAVFERDDPRIPGSAGEEQDGSDPVFGRLKRLPASRDEVEAITAGLPPEQFLEALDFDANRDLVTSGRLKDFRILHIASHTVYQAQKPDLTAIVLSRFDPRGRPRDGFLRIANVRALQFRADLVVLSSCNSAFGRNIRGEGRMGLPQAFLSAGAASVVMTAWDIGDQSTAELMRTFYRNILQSGVTPSQGLRAAQIAMWRAPQRNAPWHWAGFMAQGEWRIDPLSLNKIPPNVSSQGGDPRRRR